MVYLARLVERVLEFWNESWEFRFLVTKPMSFGTARMKLFWIGPLKMKSQVTKLLGFGSKKFRGGARFSAQCQPNT
jgi:hypothetical protein